MNKHMDNYNTNINICVDNKTIEMVNVLKNLLYVNDFFMISNWVDMKSAGKKFIANPENATSTDRDNCLTAIQLPIALTLKNFKKRRKNGRDIKLIKAVETNNYSTIVNILVSSAWSYWQDHGFQINANNGRDYIAIKFQIENYEKNKQKKDFQKAQIEHIGAIIDFQKAQKIGAFQEILDFLETEEILENNDFED